MLNFLRKTRLKEMKGKYLKYAIGEIVLVVMGILIALSISNYNERRKDRAFEHDILAEINQNLALDSTSLSMILDDFLKAQTAFVKIENTTNEVIINDSLKWWLGDVIQFDRFRPISSAFEVLKSKNLGIITNRTLRLDITTYYDNHVNWIAQSLGDVEKSFNNDWVPELKTSFVDMKFKSYVTPRSPKAWLSDEKNIVLLDLHKDNRNGAINPMREALQLISKIRKTINTELNR